MFQQRRDRQQRAVALFRARGLIGRRPVVRPVDPGYAGPGHGLFAAAAARDGIEADFAFEAFGAFLRERTRPARQDLKARRDDLGVAVLGVERGGRYAERAGQDRRQSETMQALTLRALTLRALTLR